MSRRQEFKFHRFQCVVDGGYLRHEISRDPDLPGLRWACEKCESLAHDDHLEGLLFRLDKIAGGAR